MLKKSMLIPSLVAMALGAIIVTPSCAAAPDPAQPSADQEQVGETQEALCSPACGSGLTCCANFFCANLLTTAAFCGSCSHRCASGEICANGVCGTPCGSDPRVTCGQLGKTCTADGICGDVTCTTNADCDANGTCCGGLCKYVGYDSQHCQDCSTGCICGNGAICCRNPSDTFSNCTDHANCVGPNNTWGTDLGCH